MNDKNIRNSNCISLTISVLKIALHCLHFSLQSACLKSGPEFPIPQRNPSGPSLPLLNSLFPHFSTTLNQDIS